MEQTHSQPWLQGRDQDIQLLDQIIRHARAEDKRIRTNPDGLSPAVLGPLKRRKRRLLNEARENKRNMFTQWETEWLDHKAEQADQAAAHGHMGTVFQIIRELSQAKEHRRRFGLRRQDNPTEEAEAWKLHFEAIQSGVGHRSQTQYGRMSNPNNRINKIWTNLQLGKNFYAQSATCSVARLQVQICS